MALFGDIPCIEPRGRDLRVTLKSGTELHLDRFADDDVTDGLHMWDRTRDVVDLGEWEYSTQGQGQDEWTDLYASPSPAVQDSMVDYLFVSPDDSFNPSSRIVVIQNLPALVRKLSTSGGDSR